MSAYIRLFVTDVVFVLLTKETVTDRRRVRLPSRHTTVGTYAVFDFLTEEIIFLKLGNLPLLILSVGILNGHPAPS